jgi:beta-galactoside alpha-2,6-sialyltransferase (sialyltransferase 1)
MTDLVNISDSHQLVMRFNHAPTKGFEVDVGTRTDVRIVNDLVIRDTKYWVVPSFNFLEDPMYRNLTLVGWVPHQKYVSRRHFFSSCKCEQ